MRYYERRLPHWHPEGTALFITWRLYGSLPRVPGLILGPNAGKAFVEMDRALAREATGPHWLKDERIAQCVYDTLIYGEERLRLYGLRAWVIMSNHVHTVIYPKAALPRITKAIKNFSANRANEILDRKGQPFWLDESYDHWVRNGTELEKIVRYIESNPVAAGLVQKPEDWRFSSAWAGRRPAPQGDYA